VPVWRHKASLQLVAEEPVLDVAGGDGLFLSLLRNERGVNQVTLVDISPVGVEKARGKGITAEVIDITERLPFEDNSFGTACALDVLEHLHNPLPVLKDMGRVARSVVICCAEFSLLEGTGPNGARTGPFRVRTSEGTCTLVQP
jgi:ubiquinone/menaquinone biosynthesis C-methylase UbiE